MPRTAGARNQPDEVKLAVALLRRAGYEVEQIAEILSIGTGSVRNFANPSGARGFFRGVAYDDLTGDHAWQVIDLLYGKNDAEEAVA